MHSFTDLEKTNTAADWLLVCRRNYIYNYMLRIYTYQFSEIVVFLRIV